MYPYIIPDNPAHGEGLGLLSFGLGLLCNYQLEEHADSAAAIGICRRSGIGRVRHLVVGQLWVQERLREGRFSHFKFLGEDHPADLLTKHLPGPAVQKHFASLRVTKITGRAESAPKVSAAVKAWLKPALSGRG